MTLLIHFYTIISATAKILQPQTYVAPDTGPIGYEIFDLLGGPLILAEPDPVNEFNFGSAPAGWGSASFENGARHMKNSDIEVRLGETAEYYKTRPKFFNPPDGCVWQYPASEIGGGIDYVALVAEGDIDTLLRFKCAVFRNTMDRNAPVYFNMWVDVDSTETFKTHVVNNLEVKGPEAASGIRIQGLRSVDELVRVRVRVSSRKIYHPHGMATDGEVEDYIIYTPEVETAYRAQAETPKNNLTKKKDNTTRKLTMVNTYVPGDKSNPLYAPYKAEVNPNYAQGGPAQWRHPGRDTRLLEMVELMMSYTSHNPYDQVKGFFINREFQVNHYDQVFGQRQESGKPWFDPSIYSIVHDVWGTADAQCFLTDGVEDYIQLKRIGGKYNYWHGLEYGEALRRWFTWQASGDTQVYYLNSYHSK